MILGVNSASSNLARYVTEPPVQRTSHMEDGSSLQSLLKKASTSLQRGRERFFLELG